MYHVSQLAIDIGHAVPVGDDSQYRFALILDAEDRIAELQLLAASVRVGLRGIRPI